MVRGDDAAARSARLRRMPGSTRSRLPQPPQGCRSTPDTTFWGRFATRGLGRPVAVAGRRPGRPAGAGGAVPAHPASACPTTARCPPICRSAGLRPDAGGLRRRRQRTARRRRRARRRPSVRRRRSTELAAGQRGSRRRAAGRHRRGRPLLGRADPQHARPTTTAVIYEVTPDRRPGLTTPPPTLVERLRADLATRPRAPACEAHVGGATATLIDLTDLVTQYLPLRDRRRRARRLHPAGARVPVDPRAAQGRDHEPAVDRRRLRRGRRRVPVGLGQGGWSASPRPSRSCRSCRS